MRTKHKSSNQRRHAAARTFGWNTFMRWFSGPDADEMESGRRPTAKAPVIAGQGTLTALPSGSMQQRTKELPKVPPQTAHTAMSAAEARELARIAALDAAQRVTGLAARPAYRIGTDVPLFRDEQALTGYEERRDAALRRLQRIGQPWADGHGVALGSDQSPKTVVFSTGDYREFAGGQSPKAGSR